MGAILPLTALAPRGAAPARGFARARRIAAALFVADLRQRTRSPRFWIVALAVTAAGWWCLPPVNAGYMIVAIGDHSVMWQRDRQHRDAVRDRLIPLLGEAAALDYDIGNPQVFDALFAVAIEMHSAAYTPMRVLGATSEAMVQGKRK